MVEDNDGNNLRSLIHSVSFFRFVPSGQAGRPAICHYVWLVAWDISLEPEKAEEREMKRIESEKLNRKKKKRSRKKEEEEQKQVEEEQKKVEEEQKQVEEEQKEVEEEQSAKKQRKKD